MNNPLNKAIAAFIVVALALVAIPVTGQGTAAFGTVVVTGDGDVTYALTAQGAGTLVFVDDDADAAFDSDEPVYYAPAGAAANTVGNDVRIANTGSQAAGSQIRTSHSDFNNPTTAMPGNLAFFDSNNDGFFGSNDVLYWDTDASSTATVNDVILSGSNAGNVVTGAAANNNPLAAAPVAATFAFFDTNGDTTYNAGDVVYWDADGSTTATIQDVRFGTIVGESFGSVVETGDQDVTYALTAQATGTLVFVDDDADAAFDSDEPVFYAPAGAGTNVVGNDVRIANTGSQAAGSQVRTSHSDFNNPTTAMPGNLAFFDSNNDGNFGANDVLYWDTDAGATVTVNDVILSGANAGTVVTGAAANNNPLAAAPGGAQFTFFDSNGDTTYNAGDVVYWDADGTATATVMDVRFGTIVGKGFGTVVSKGDGDVTYALAAQATGTLVFVDDDADAAFDSDEPVFYAPAGAAANVVGNDVRIANTGSQAAGSQVRTSHSDFNNPTTAMPGNLAFFDSNNDGFFGSNDVLYWDTDAGATVTVNDVILSGANAGTVVTGAAANNNPLAGAPVGAQFAFFDTNGDTTYNANDVIYWDADGSLTATIQDVRFGGDVPSGGDGTTPTEPTTTPTEPTEPTTTPTEPTQPTTTPTEPTEPTTTPTQPTEPTTPTDGEDEPSTPGFELIALVAALGAALVLVRRRN